MTRLTDHPEDDQFPTWSPDGERIAFGSLRDGGSWHIYVINADGSNPTRLASGSEPDWSGNPIPTSPTFKEIDYFALGDSIASGHGLMDDGIVCRRSFNAYPWKVKEMLNTRYDKVNFHNVTCSGATAGTSEDIDHEFKHFSNQINYVIKNLSDRPTLVSITMGANDFGWSDPWSFLSHLYEENEDEYQQFVDHTVIGVNVMIVQSERKSYKKSKF